MRYRDKALDNPINWSFRVGRAFGITIRVHLAFIVGVVVLVAMEMPDADSAGSVSFGRVLVDALGTYAILFFIVLMHEFGHCYGARRTGGEADEILLWPLGGLATVNPPHEPKAHMITTLAGPAVNVVFCVVSAVVLVAWVGSLGAVPWNPLHPASPVGSFIFPTTGQTWLIRFFGVSYILLIVNLFPIFPFDGGRVLQAWLWARKGYQASMALATGTGMVGAIVIGCIGILCSEWLLIMIAAFGYLTCWQSRRVLREQGEFEAASGMDFGGGHAFGESEDSERQRRPGFFARRRMKRVALQAQKERRERERQAALVEEALRQIASGGVESLTPQQRRALKEETARRQLTNGGADRTTGPS